MKNIRFKRVALMLVLLAVTLSAVTGGTIAWFTDSVESTDNVIKSGTLDMTVEYKKDWDDEWQTVEKDTKLFKTPCMSPAIPKPCSSALRTPAIWRSSMIWRFLWKIL